MAVAARRALISNWCPLRMFCTICRPELPISSSTSAAVRLLVMRLVAANLSMSPTLPGHFGTDEYRDLRWTMVRVAVYAGVGSRAAARPLPRLQLLPRLRWCVPSRRIEQRAASLDYCNRARQICGVQPLHGAEGLAGDFFWFEVQRREPLPGITRMKSMMNPVSRNGRPRQSQSSSDSWMPAINTGCGLDSTNVR